VCTSMAQGWELVPFTRSCQELEPAWDGGWRMNRRCDALTRAIQDEAPVEDFLATLDACEASYELDYLVDVLLAGSRVDVVVTEWIRRGCISGDAVHSLFRKLAEWWTYIDRRDDVRRTVQQIVDADAVRPLRTQDTDFFVIVQRPKTLFATLLQDGFVRESLFPIVLLFIDAGLAQTPPASGWHCSPLVLACLEANRVFNHATRHALCTIFHRLVERGDSYSMMDKPLMRGGLTSDIAIRMTCLCMLHCLGIRCPGKFRYLQTKHNVQSWPLMQAVHSGSVRMIRDVIAGKTPGVVFPGLPASPENAETLRYLRERHLEQDAADACCQRLLRTFRPGYMPLSAMYCPFAYRASMLLLCVHRLRREGRMCMPVELVFEIIHCMHQSYLAEDDLSDVCIPRVDHTTIYWGEDD
jgi:hypothetical protein